MSLLPALAPKIIVPTAVKEELATGLQYGVDLPVLEELAWVSIRQPAGTAVLPLAAGLGPGETQVLALALEAAGAMVILDDALARRAAAALGIRLTGTLGVLLAGKQSGLIPAVQPILDRLQRRGFRLSVPTRRAVLHLAGEA